MSNVDILNSSQPAVDITTPAPVTPVTPDAAGTAQPAAGQTATAEDVEGVKTPGETPAPKPATTLVTPAFVTAATESAVLAALDKLEGKTADVQKAVAEAAAALGAVNTLTGNLFTANILGGLVTSVTDAARGNLGAPFAALYAQLNVGLDELLAEYPESVPLKTAADSARTIMDILEKGKAHENTEELAAALANLASLALVESGASDEAVMAAALAATLHNALGVVSEAAALGDKLTALLAGMAAQFPSLVTLPDALAVSGKLTNEAVLGLTMLLAAKVQQELAVLLETSDDEFRAMREEQLRRQDITRSMEQGLERSSLLRESQAVSAAAVFAAFSQCGAEAAQSINALILMRQVDSVPRNPV